VVLDVSEIYSNRWYHQNQLVQQAYIKQLHTLAHQIRISEITSTDASAISSQGIQRQSWKHKTMPPLITSEVSCAIFEKKHVCQRNRCFTTTEVHTKWSGPYLVTVDNIEIGDRGGQPTGPRTLGGGFFHVGLPEGHMISPFTCECIIIISEKSIRYSLELLHQTRGFAGTQPSVWPWYYRNMTITTPAIRTSLQRPHTWRQPRQT